MCGCAAVNPTWIWPWEDAMRRTTFRRRTCRWCAIFAPNISSPVRRKRMSKAAGVFAARARRAGSAPWDFILRGKSTRKPACPSGSSQTRSAARILNCGSHRRRCWARLPSLRMQNRCVNPSRSIRGNSRKHCLVLNNGRPQAAPPCRAAASRRICASFSSATAPPPATPA